MLGAVLTRLPEQDRAVDLPIGWTRRLLVLLPPVAYCTWATRTPKSDRDPSDHRVDVHESEDVAQRHHQDCRVNTLLASVSARKSGPVIMLSGETDVTTIAELRELASARCPGDATPDDRCVRVEFRRFDVGRVLVLSPGPRGSTAVARCCAAKGSGQDAA